MHRILRSWSIPAALTPVALGSLAIWGIASAQPPLPTVPPGGLPLTAPAEDESPAPAAPAEATPSTTPAAGTTAQPIVADEVPIDREALLKGLADTDLSKAQKALEELERGRIYPPAAVPTLNKLLTQADPEIVVRAQRYLAGYGATAAPVLPQLGRNLARENERVRAYALYAIGRIGVPEDAVLQKIVDLTADDSELVRRIALRTLGQFRLPNRRLVPMYAAALQVADPNHQHQALRSLAAMGRDAVPFLCTALQSPDTAWWAATVVGEIGSDATEAVPYLVPLLDSDEPETQLQAMIALAQIGQPVPTAAAKARTVLESDAPLGLRYAAAYLLTQVAQDDQSKTTLAKYADDEDDLLKMLSRWGVYRISQDDEDREAAVEVVLEGLDNPNDLVKRTAVQLLVETYDPTEQLDKRVIEIVRSAEPEVRGQMLVALVQMRAKAVPHLIPLLDDEEVHDIALTGIQMIGPDAAEAAPKLAEMLKTAEGEMRTQIQVALGRIGPPAKPAVPELIKSLDSDDTRIEETAAYALGSIGKEAASAVSDLEDELDDETGVYPAAWALVRMGVRKPAVMAVVEKGLADPSPEVRYGSLSAYSAMVPLPEDARKRIEAMLKAEMDPQVKAEAERVLALGADVKSRQAGEAGR